jgi:hypothetical protein
VSHDFDARVDGMRRGQSGPLTARHRVPLCTPSVSKLVDAQERRGWGARSGQQVPVISAAVLARRSGVAELGMELARIQDEQPAARIRFPGPPAALLVQRRTAGGRRTGARPEPRRWPGSRFDLRRPGTYPVRQPAAIPIAPLTCRARRPDVWGLWRVRGLARRTRSSRGRWRRPRGRPAKDVRWLTLSN